MKTLAIIGILLSFCGILISIANWFFFTLQLPANKMEHILPGGKLQITVWGGLEHHEHSYTMLALLIGIFAFFLVQSIKILTISNPKNAQNEN